MKRILPLILLTISISAFGATYYVAPTGGSDSNPGTLAQPWATWQKAFTTPVAGDTVFFRGGVWYPSVPAVGNNIIQIMPDTGMGHNGEPGNPICFFAYPPDYSAGNIPILDCRNVVAPGTSGTNRYLTGIMMYDVHFHKWKGLTIRNIYQREDYVDVKAVNAYPVSNMNYEGITIHNIGGAGWFMNHVVGDESIAWLGYGWDGSGYIPYDTTSWINCDTYQVCDSFPANTGQVPGNMSDAFKLVSFPKPGYYTFDGCRAWHAGDDGFDTPNGSSTVIINNCWSFYHLYPGYAMEGNGFKMPAGNYEDDPITTQRQVMTNCISAYNNCGLYTPEGAVITERGIWNIYNNTFYSNTIGLVMDNLSPFDTTLAYFYNNIVYKTYQNDAGGRQTIVDARRYYYESNNTFDYADSSIVGSLAFWTPTDTVTITDADFILTDSITGISQMSAARKADGSLPNIDFLKLRPTSDLINMGRDVGLPYSDTAPDIGYYEYSTGPQIIANHSIVDDYENIPQFYIDSVKKMWVSYAGESHSYGIRHGLLSLEAIDPTYAVSVIESGTPEAYTTSNLRASGATWGDLNNTSGWIYSYGEEDWYTSPAAVSRTKAGLQYCNDNGPALTALGFGFCWDWYTSDFAQYISATKEYVAYCEANDIATKVFFTTGTVDAMPNTNESYTDYLGYELIRDSVAADTTRILFDYADILCYDDDGSGPTTNTYNGNVYPHITAANLGDGNIAHISAVGTMRLGKAMWWMLARMAGWDGNVTVYSEQEVDSTATDILTFTLADQTGAATINATNHTVSIEVDYTADITDLTPTITLSYGATIAPTSGTSQNFTSPVTYTVTALDETTTQEWVVTVTQAEEPATPASDSATVKYRGLILKL